MMMILLYHFTMDITLIQRQTQESDLGLGNVMAANLRFIFSFYKSTLAFRFLNCISAQYIQKLY